MVQKIGRRITRQKFGTKRVPSLNLLILTTPRVHFILMLTNEVKGSTVGEMFTFQISY